MDFVDSFSLMDDSDRTDDDENAQNAVTLMTVHAAKGLEFPYVYLIGLEQKLFPHERALLEGAEEEERRLFYVAVTRAKANLVITHANQRYRHGRMYTQRPSQFLINISDKFAERLSHRDYFSNVSDEQFDATFAELYAMFDKRASQSK